MESTFISEFNKVALELALVQIIDEIKKCAVCYPAHQAESTAFHNAGAAVSLRLACSLNWPLRMRCISSMPAMMTAALLNRLNPSMTLIRDLMFR